MVADTEGEKNDMKGLAVLDPTNFINITEIKGGVTAGKHKLGTSSIGKEASPSSGAAAAVITDYKQAVVVWLQRKDTCVSSIYEAAQKVPEALDSLVTILFNWTRKFAQPLMN